MVTDDFQVLPESISCAHPLLLRHGINDNSGVEEWKINVGLEEVSYMALSAIYWNLNYSSLFSDISTWLVPIYSSNDTERACGHL